MRRAARISLAMIFAVAAMLAPALRGGLTIVAFAQDVGNVPMGEIGDPQAGFEYAQTNCELCHAIGEEKSPNPKAPRFRDVANTPGMTPTALKVWLQNANHPTMPNIMIRGQDLRNLTAYILSLKD
jgi:mono/diheme cytochrome c family protein